MELSTTDAAIDDCGADLEDGLWQANRKLLRLGRDVLLAIDRLELARNPCGFFAKTFRLDRCNPQPKGAPP